MTTTIQTIIKSIMFLTLSGGILVSCNSRKSKNDTNQTNIKKTALESGDNSKEVLFEDFNKRFHEILIQENLMQSALTDKVDTLCNEINIYLLDNMLKEAASNPPEDISEDNWLLGYNQMMAIAGNRLGKDATASFYQLAADSKASSVMRDYAIQHYLRTESKVLIQMQSSTEKKSSLAYLQQVLDRSGNLVSNRDKLPSTLPGTALLGLAALSMSYEKHSEEFALIREKVNQLAVPILINMEAYDEFVVTSAIQATSRLKIDKTGPLVWNAALNQSASTAVRLSAIGSLENYPDLVDIAVIENSCKNKKILSDAVSKLQNKIISN